MLGRGHDPESDWCRFPVGKCICSNVGYKRLSEGDEGWSDMLMGDDDPDNPNPSTSGVDMAEELLFYNDNQSFQSVVVEKNLCASDLCQLLAMKNRVTKSKHWCIFECWNDLGLERLLEDHEYILAAFRDMKNFSLHSNLQYKFRKDFRKYEFFHHPDQFFPQNMVNVEEGKSNKSDKNEFRVTPTQDLVRNEYECPVLYSHIWVRDERKRTWSKSFLVLRGPKLYITPKLSMVTKFMRAHTAEQAFELISVPPIPNHVRLFGEYICEYADLRAYHAYTTLNAKNQLRAPTEWGIVLRPATIPTTTAAAKSDSPPPPAKTAEPPSSGSVEFDDVSTASSTDLRCLACESDKVRSCWITAMRLAKYGKQLRENYRAFRNKQGDNVSKDYSSYSVPNESVRSRVAMDFTGPVGRIVEDPQEAHAIATAEGYAWQRRWRGGGVRPATTSALPAPDGVHCAQPWFHRGMSRERATEVVNRHGTVNGVFLVRDSRSNPGSFVITYKFNGKVLHAQVNPIMDPLKERAVLSLDNGTTKFYDLLQLVEFYQLNAGCLPTRLTHYVSFALTEDEDVSMTQMRNAEKSN